MKHVCFLIMQTDLHFDGWYAIWYLAFGICDMDLSFGFETSNLLVANDSKTLYRMKMKHSLI